MKEVEMGRMWYACERTSYRVLMEKPEEIIWKT
jgi:hypothetical protein